MGVVTDHASWMISTYIDTQSGIFIMNRKCPVTYSQKLNVAPVQVSIP